MKKILALILILLALGAVSYFYFQADQKQSASKTLSSAIPNQFPIAFESENWEKVFAKVDTFPYFETMKKQDWIIGSQLNLEEVQSLQVFFQNQNLPALSPKMLLAFGNAGNSQLGIILAAQLKQAFSINQVKEALQKGNIVFSSNQFEQHEIITIESDPNGSLHQASFAISNQIFLYSHQASFVEDALISLSKEEDSWLGITQKLEGTEDLKCFFKPKQLDYLASYFVDPNYAELMNAFAQVSANSVFQINLFQESLNISGYVNADEGTLIDSLQAFKAADVSVLENLPANTAIYRSLGIENNQDQFKQNFDLKRFHSFIDEVIVLFTLESYNDQLEDRQGAMISLLDEDYLEVLRSIDSTIIPYKLEGDIQVYNSSLGPELNAYLYAEEYFADEVYFAKVNDLLVFSSTYAVCEQFIFAQKEAKTLRTKSEYLEFKSAAASNTNLEYYFNLALLQPYLSTITTSNSWQTLFEQVSVQFVHLGQDVYGNGKISFKSSKQEGSKMLWAVNLDTTASMAPQLVLNHNTDKHEVLIQDNNNQLYLINASGEILWRTTLKGKILSDVKQIDYYKNRKLQYVFNTEDYIYVVDRNGELVDGFPIKLPSKATNGMLLVNYDNNGKYRYMVACDNGNVYGYEKNGSPLAGWNPKKDVGIVTSPIQHKLFAGKDYLYFNNSAGKFFALNRKGEDRFPPLATKNKNNSFHFMDNGFEGGDAGVAISIALNGGMNERVLLDSTYTVCLPENSLLQSTIAYGFASEANFKFQQSQWQNYASFTASESIQDIESFSYKNKLWFVLTTANQTYLIDEIGNAHSDFPVASQALSFVDLIPGKSKLLVYADANGTVKVLEIGWTN